MNPDRSIVTLTVLIRSGTPSTSCGNGSLVVVICAVFGLMAIVARTTTFPRLNGPATAGVTMDSPNGAPLYGPVRYTRPVSHNGSEPAPAATWSCPIRLASPHSPLDACGSGHCSTPFT